MTIDPRSLFDLCERHGIRRLRVFGSHARGDATPSSDVDLIADFTEGKSLMELVQIERDLAERLGLRVDLLTEGSLSPYLRERILDEARVLYERAA